MDSKKQSNGLNVLMIQNDAFLSRIFNLRWGKFSGTECNQKVIHAALSDKNFDRIDFEIPADNFLAISSLTETGCILSSSKAFYKHHKGGNRIPCDHHDSSFSFFPAEISDAQEIAEIAIESFVLDRYRNTPGIEKNKIKELYHSWIKNNIRYRCEKVIVCKQEKAIVGFLCVMDEKDHYYFELIGVSLKLQNRGIGSLMLKEALLQYGDKNCICVTQIHNTPMQYLLQKEGFRVFKTHLIFTRCPIP